MALRRISTATVAVAPKLLVLFLWLVVAACDTRPGAGSPAPPGWMIYSSTPPDQDARFCGNWSKTAWNVTLAGASVTISRQGDLRQSNPDQVIPFRNGWLIGTNRGEWGGELAWFNQDKTRKTVLAKENVVAITETDFGTLVLAGTDHMGLGRGMALIVSGEGPLPPSATIYAPLDATPYSIAKDRNGNLIVVTGKGVLRIKAGREVQKLFASDYSSLHPGSVATTPSGTIYVGMRHFVTRLTPAGDAYQEDWLVPANCTSFRQKGLDCECYGK